MGLLSKAELRQLAQRQRRGREPAACVCWLAVHSYMDGYRAEPATAVFKANVAAVGERGLTDSGETTTSAGNGEAGDGQAHEDTAAEGSPGSCAELWSRRPHVALQRQGW